MVKPATRSLPNRRSVKIAAAVLFTAPVALLSACSPNEPVSSTPHLRCVSVAEAIDLISADRDGMVRISNSSNSRR